MSKYERRMQFEALCAMREQYAHLGDDDRRAAMSVADAIAWAEALLASVLTAPSSDGDAAIDQ
jgi:hypothetical protein